MFQQFSKFFIYIIFFVALGVISPFFISNVYSATYKCDTPAEKQVCTELLNQTEKEISSLATELSAKKQEGASLARDKALLDLKVKQAQLQIKAHEISIANLGKDIIVKTKTIASLNEKIEESRESLSQLIRKTREFDSVSTPEIFLSGEDLSDAFADLDAFDSIYESMQMTLGELRDARSANEIAKESLNKKKDQEIDTKVSIEAEKKKVEQTTAEKKKLLASNQQEQATYQKVIADKSAQAAQIKAALFKLAGAASIPFGDALNYAKAVQAKTGVDPAFLLAIITQESNLGANVGQCYLTDKDTGAGVNVNSGKIWSNLMKPTRDVKPFLEITERLGFDPFNTKVSCPIAGVAGYGGAMGPAQFIPSTWKLFDTRIANATGHDAPNPWLAEDAFMASGFYLSDLGAYGNSYSAQLRAACKYYGSGGATCSYGRSVMSYKAKLQADIDVLEN